MKLEEKYRWMTLYALEFGIISSFYVVGKDEWRLSSIITSVKEL